MNLKKTKNYLIISYHKVDKQLLKDFGKNLLFPKEFFVFDLLQTAYRMMRYNS